MGCALEAAGTVAEIEIESSKATDPLDTDWFAGELRILGVRQNHDEALARLRERQTNRSHFETDALPGELLGRLTAAGERHGIQLHIVEERAGIETLGEVCAAATKKLMGQEEYLDETLEWIRLEEPAVDGLTLDAMHLDETGRTVFQTIKRDEAARRAIVEAGMPGIAAERTAEAMHSCGAALFLTAGEPSASNWVAGGRAMMAVWLELAGAGVAMQPMSDTLLFPEERAEIFETFDVELTRDPIVMMRAGYSRETVPSSPRLPAEDFVLDSRAGVEAT